MNQPEYRYDWRTTRLGEPVWIYYRKEWRRVIVKRLGRKMVKVSLGSKLLNRAYNELRRSI